MANIKQYYGIKFPLTADNDKGFLFDLNETIEDKVASEILHVLLTPKRTRIRRPFFGTDLIKYIFEPDGKDTWEGVRTEAVENVKKFVPSASLDDIQIIKKEDDDHTILLSLKYSVTKGATIENNTLVVRL